MSLTRLCPRCFRALTSPRFKQTSRARISQAGPPPIAFDRQISWWPFRTSAPLTPSPPENETSQLDPPTADQSPSEETPRNANFHQHNISSIEHTLAQSLQQVEQKCTEIEEEANRIAEEQLAKWDEATPVSESVSPPFQDPLGHLTFEEQTAYLANPPDEYLRTLEDRARVRESYEQEMFLADPLTYWKFASHVKPNFGADSLPEWKPWSMERRLEVMEKYRRYDERFQDQIKQVFEKFDSENFRYDMKQHVINSVKKHPDGAAISPTSVSTTAKKTRRERKAIKMANKTFASACVLANNMALEELPLVVVKRKTHRATIRARNAELNRLWRRRIQELSVFDDLNEDGQTASEESVKKSCEFVEQKSAETGTQNQELEDCGTLPPYVEIGSVDWNSIHREA